jgi:truncated hemoglobin YjbI
MPKKEPTPEERDAQLRAFQQAARELKCDDDAERFDERVRKLAHAAPMPNPKTAE